MMLEISEISRERFAPFLLLVFTISFYYVEIFSERRITLESDLHEIRSIRHAFYRGVKRTKVNLIELRRFHGMYSQSSFALQFVSPWISKHVDIANIFSHSHKASFCSSPTAAIFRKRSLTRGVQ